MPLLLELNSEIIVLPIIWMELILVIFLILITSPDLENINVLFTYAPLSSQQLIDWMGNISAATLKLFALILLRRY